MFEIVSEAPEPTLKPEFVALARAPVPTVELVSVGETVVVSAVPPN